MVGRIVSAGGGARVRAIPGRAKQTGGCEMKDMVNINKMSVYRRGGEWIAERDEGYWESKHETKAAAIADAIQVAEEEVKDWQETVELLKEELKGMDK